MLNSILILIPAVKPKAIQPLMKKRLNQAMKNLNSTRVQKIRQNQKRHFQTYRNLAHQTL